MTAFTIFAIVLTIAYIIYYFGLIQIDLAAFRKKDKIDEEEISLGTDETDELSTKNVVEDLNTGSFNLVEPQMEVEEQQEIAEADETDTPTDGSGENIPNGEGADIHTYSEDEDKVEPDKKVADADDAFDPELRQKKYDVKNVYEPQSSPEVQNHADTVNSSLEQIQRHSTSIYSESFLDTLKNNPNGDTNIEITNVQSRL